MREVLAAGVTGEQIEDALAVCSAFNTTNRLADAFDFEQLSPAGFDAGARYLPKRGYRSAVNIRSCRDPRDQIAAAPADERTQLPR
ncbi:hypothetical protein [Nocardia fluminea]|uniref:hypothetical protein n=1 Tax=Nocardia fluminea TaxID=134984 RepID=UPI003D144252